MLSSLAKATTRVAAPAMTRSLATAAASPAPVKLSGFQYFRKYYLSDSATYPIILIISTAACMLTFAGIRQATSNPDVAWDKSDRHTYIKDDVEEKAMKHFTHPLREHAKQDGASRVFSGINNLGTAAKITQ